MDHSKVHGKNNFPERFIFNLEVDDIQKEVKKLDENWTKISSTLNLQDRQSCRKPALAYYHAYLPEFL